MLSFLTGLCVLFLILFVIILVLIFFAHHAEKQELEMEQQYQKTSKQYQQEAASTLRGARALTIEEEVALIAAKIEWAANRSQNK